MKDIIIEIKANSMGGLNDGFDAFEREIVNLKIYIR